MGCSAAGRQGLGNAPPVSGCSIIEMQRATGISSSLVGVCHCRRFGGGGVGVGWRREGIRDEFRKSQAERAPLLWSSTCSQKSSPLGPSGEQACGCGCGWGCGWVGGAINIIHSRGTNRVGGVMYSWASGGARGGRSRLHLSCHATGVIPLTFVFYMSPRRPGTFINANRGQRWRRARAGVCGRCFIKAFDLSSAVRKESFLGLITC